MYSSEYTRHVPYTPTAKLKIPLYENDADNESSTCDILDKNLTKLIALNNCNRRNEESKRKWLIKRRRENE
jgi:hypothetical protein